jgi:hypothetical protein
LLPLRPLHPVSKARPDSESLEGYLGRSQRWKFLPDGSDISQWLFTIYPPFLRRCEGR